MNYFFVLGNNPALSAAEISAIFPNIKGEMASGGIFLLNSKEAINCPELIKRLGGTIKIGEITKNVNDFNESRLAKDIKNVLVGKNLGQKINFGFSNYTDKKINIKVLGMETKKYLREAGLNCRWVVSREKILSSVVVEQNKLINSGAEIIFIKSDHRYYLGKTLAVQPFKELSFRDYGRPGRDDLSGMLPPKLAQIMINLAQAPAVGIILDPFCGSGTILTEALLMGYNNLIGADISAKAIKDTNNNINWIKEKFRIESKEIKTYEISAPEISKIMKPNSVDAIITEPYLGPQRGWHEIDKTIKDLEKLYAASLQEFKKILKNNGTIVMIWPMFALRQGGRMFYKKINPNISGFKRSGPPLQYGREGQKVWREIVVLTPMK